MASMCTADQTCVFVRGDYDQLLRINLPAEARLAIEQARIYDGAANDIPGFIASRRNFDVAQGIDDRNQRCSGVLEQSWRIGGASPAESAALAAFQSNPNLRAVRASCVEAYGSHAPPADALINFQGVDERVGPIVKYTVLDTHACDP